MSRLLLLASLVALPGVAWAGPQQKAPEGTGQPAQATPSSSDNYEVLVARYLETARLTASGGPPPEAGAWMTALMGDLRARRVNDLVTVRVEEVVVAKGSADSTVKKESSGAAGVGQFFGVETLVPSAVNLDNLVAVGAGTDFKGGGSTARAGTLSATLTARVAEVLPNGDLVIEGVREIDINGDRQIIVLTGVARVVDIRPGNVLPSAAIGQLRIRYFGRGLIKDSLSPGWLIRVLNKIF
jgi:flagellar L-ring protein precursor FlgH